jgi:hypothetical protein
VFLCCRIGEHSTTKSTALGPHLLHTWPWMQPVFRKSNLQAVVSRDGRVSMYWRSMSNQGTSSTSSLS